MTIIIEGADNLGKTTLADALGPRVHMTKPGPDFDFNYIAHLRYGMVHDRFHLGAVVYGLLLKAHDAPSIRDIRRQHDYMTFHCRVRTLILFTDSEGWYEDRLLNSPRAEMFDVDTIKEANRIYRKLFTDWAGVSTLNVGPQFATPEIARWILRA